MFARRKEGKTSFGPARENFSNLQREIMMFLLLRHAGTKQKQIIKSLIKINLCPAEKKARIKNTKPENAEEN